MWTSAEAAPPGQRASRGGQSGSDSRDELNEERWEEGEEGSSSSTGVLFTVMQRRTFWGEKPSQAQAGGTFLGLCLVHPETWPPAAKHTNTRGHGGRGRWQGHAVGVTPNPACAWRATSLFLGFKKLQNQYILGKIKNAEMYQTKSKTTPKPHPKGPAPRAPLRTSPSHQLRERKKPECVS